MHIEAKAKTINTAKIEDEILPVYRKVNALLMALEGVGKQAMNAGDERVAIIELVLAIRGDLTDFKSRYGIKSDSELFAEHGRL